MASVGNPMYPAYNDQTAIADAFGRARTAFGRMSAWGGRLIGRYQNEERLNLSGQLKAWRENRPMSSGSDILRSLAQRQMEQKRQREDRGSNLIDELASTHHKATTPAVRQKQTMIQVCLGPDCSGSGGGAALLEIEDLVAAKEGTPETVTVTPGECRDFCTMGPNVYVTHNAGQSDKEGHFTKVDCPEACRKVYTSVFKGEEQEETACVYSKASPLASTLLKRRQDGIRWRMHIEKTRKEKRLRVRQRAP
ncbi:hypothetical protein ACHAWF_016536 [Thalassiosira exigua]